VAGQWTKCWWPRRDRDWDWSGDRARMVSMVKRGGTGRSR
jgi:hypothetical protein